MNISSASRGRGASGPQGSGEPQHIASVDAQVSGSLAENRGRQIMQVYAFRRFCEPVEPMEWRDPDPVGTEVVVEVTRCGVCHSDLHMQQGYYDLGGGERMNFADRGLLPPLVPGHEVLGRLIAKGPEAPIADDQIGKTFLVYSWIGCGQCEYCLRAEDHLCAKPCSIGVQRPGGYAEKCLVPHPKYLVDVSGLDPTLAATFACSGLTAYGALQKAVGAPERDLLVIIGAGGVGLSALQLAKGFGWRRIVVADIDAIKRERALAFGAWRAVNPRDETQMSALQAEPGGVVSVVDFVGAKETAELGLRLLRKGGAYVVAGLFGGAVNLSLPPILLRSVSIRGSCVGSLDDLKALISLARRGLVAPIPCETMEFSQANDALERLRAGNVEGRLVLARR